MKMHARFHMICFLAWNIMKFNRKTIVQFVLNMCLIGVVFSACPMKKRRFCANVGQSGIEMLPEAVTQNVMCSFLDDASLVSLNQASRTLHVTTQQELCSRHAEQTAYNIARYVYQTFVTVMTETPTEELDGISALFPCLREATYQMRLWFTGYSLRSTSFESRLRAYPAYYEQIATMYKSFYEAHPDEQSALFLLGTIATQIHYYFQYVVRKECASIMFGLEPASMLRHADSLSLVTQPLYRLRATHRDVEDIARLRGQLEGCRACVNVPVIFATCELFKLMHCMNSIENIKRALHDLCIVTQQYIPAIVEPMISENMCKLRLREFHDVMSALLGLQLPSFVVE